jgi:hypothetical protein
MQYWITPILGAVIAGAYGILHLRDQWNIGGEHAFRASGTIVAYAIIGLIVGAAVAMFLPSKKSN